jgi:hypothetical protein
MMFAAPTLYRHWLEMRGPLKVGAVLVFLLSIPGFLLSVATPPMVLPLTAHAWLSCAAGLVCTLLLGGTGLGALSFTGCAASSFTLTLPIPRVVWILTRVALGFVATVFLMGAVLAADVAAFGGGSASFAAMARTSVITGLVAMSLQVLVGLVLPIWKDWLGPVAMTVVFSVFVILASDALNDIEPPLWLQAPIRALSTTPPDLWLTLAALAVIIGSAVALAVVIAGRRDF